MEYAKKPEWLRIRVRSTQELNQVEEIMKALDLHTVCEEAACPNRMECFSKRTAAFMILGSICTRNCTFCNVNKERPIRIDEEEPIHVANAVQQLRLKHVVITSVTRDDLPDGGAEHFAQVIYQIKKVSRDVVIEVLIPDFKGDKDALGKVITAKPQIINHNVETVPRLYSVVRPMAVYERSLSLLSNVKAMSKGIYTKSGIMLGLGERDEEVIRVLEDLRCVQCDFLTIGQYLAPSKRHYPVAEYIHPDKFEEYKQISLEMGFKYVASGPLVRSSYQAEKAFEFHKGATVMQD